jgi:hypothetical protein
MGASSACPSIIIEAAPALLRLSSPRTSFTNCPGTSFIVVVYVAKGKARTLVLKQRLDGAKIREQRQAGPPARAA